MAEDPLAVRTPKQNKLALKMYPNPSPDKINIQLPVDAKKAKYKAELHNLSGAQVLEQALVKNTVTIDLVGLPDGSYLVGLYQDGVLVATEKVVKR